MKKLALGILVVAAMFSCSSDSSSDAAPAPTEVVIGTQTWKIKNLNVKGYRNGDLIPLVQDPTAWAALTTGAYCYYENQTANGTTYGKLYNWYAVNDPRGLAPDGWHIPSENEWNTLSAFLGGNTESGSKMKSTTGWTIPNIDATNSSGFTGLPGGLRTVIGTFDGISDAGVWWSSSEDGGTPNAIARGLLHTSTQLGIYNYDKNNGYSVRCIKD